MKIKKSQILNKTTHYSGLALSIFQEPW